MQMSRLNEVSVPVSTFYGRGLPDPGIPAGYAALIAAYELNAPLPRRLIAIGSKHTIIESGGWKLFTPRYAPDSTLEGELTFALKYEGVDLAVLSCLFQKVSAAEMVEIVQRSPTGRYARRLWFLFEWLSGEKLEIEDAQKGSYVPVLAPEMQLSTIGERVRRQRVINNLPGTPRFCPLVFRTSAIDGYLNLDLKKRARETMGAVPQDVVSRTAAFLLLADSKASYMIEGEEPPQNRIQRWGHVIGEAGSRQLDLDELVRLQKIVIGDSRFVQPGFRTEGGFVGEHERDSGRPLPEHISACPEDLPDLLQGLVDFDLTAAEYLNPVAAAAVLAFGFVYIHPFQDGNGRIHRYLIHHELAKSGFNPEGLVFPVSAVILKRIQEYREVLQSYSRRMLPCIEWESTTDRNVKVLNQTDHLYRFFDATPHVEFLFSCVQQTIEYDLPEETCFLQSYDAFRRGVESIVDMPERTIDLLFRFLWQNGGRLSTRAREHEFSALSKNEAKRIEELYAEHLEGKV